MAITGTISKEDILQQVERICCSTEFRSKSLLCSFLKFVVNETLTGKGKQLKGYVIGVEVLGKEKDFDPEQDSLVRIHAGRLRRSLKVYYLEDGKYDPVMIEIPKGNYQPQFFHNGKPLIAHEEITDDKVVASSFLPIEPTVAVLPFRNLSGDPEKEYFAHGFSEEISIELTKYEDIKIISCWSRPEADIENEKDLYSKYDARFLIDGSVQMIDHRIKILVKLVDAASGSQIWAERYSRDLSANNLIEIEEEISDEVARILGSETGLILHRLTEESKRVKPDSLDAFNAMLSFFYYEAHMSSEVALNTFEILERARMNNPDSGLILAMLANMYGNAYALDYPNKDGAYEIMGDYIEKAVKLDPYHPIIRIINSYKFFLYNEMDRFMQEINHCLSMKLNSPLRRGVLGFHLSLAGEWEKGKAILDRAMNKNLGYPLFLHGATSLYHYRKNDYEKALEEAKKYQIRGLFWGSMLRIACLGQLGRTNEAMIQIQSLKAVKPDFEQKAPFLISRFVKENELVSHVLEGLNKAGMAL